MTKELFEVGSLVIGRSSHQFELFGLDFLIDSSFKAWLIECNTNPSIEICCSLLNRLVPNMIENMLNIVVDPLFPQVERKAVKDDSDWNP
jgi:tubulin--tyrosine ligase